MFAVGALIGTLLLTGCENGSPQATATPSVVVSSFGAEPPLSGSPVPMTRPMPLCDVLLAHPPAGIVALTGKPTQEFDNAGGRQTLTCVAAGVVPGQTTRVGLDVHLERPTVQPAGQTVAEYLAARPEQLMKRACPNFPYAPLADVRNGFTCYQRISDTEAQGMVVGSTADATIVVTANVSADDQSPYQLRTAAEQVAKYVTIAVVSAGG
jgi:hypothetical protein